MTRRLPAAVAAVSLAVTAVFVVATTRGSQHTASGFPPRLETYLTTSVRLTPDDHQHLLDGGPVTKLLDADESMEVAVFGAIWINAPMHRYVEAINDIETFERGGAVRITKRISDPPTLDDFAPLHLSDDDVKDLRVCRPGDCEVKLSGPSMERFRTEVDWNAPDAGAAANRLMQRLALEYATAYLAGGNERLAVYRDNARPTRVAEEFREMIDQMPELTEYAPLMRQYLLEYPKATLPDSTSFLYWQEAEFGLKPTIRISHLTIREDSRETVVVSKMLYATHYFWTGLELRTLLPDPSRGPGFWFVTVSRSRLDGLRGFSRMFLRQRVRNEVRDGTRAVLQRTKQVLEAGS